MRPYVLAEANWKTVRETPYEVAVLPWGATEAHNYHLPYATDNIQNEWIAAEAARLAWERGAKVVVLPNVPFGVNTGQLDIRLDLNMNPSTQAAVLRDLVDALTRQGIPKLAVMNGHGGNNFRQMLRELQPQFPNVFLCTFNWYDTIRWADYFEDQGDHAGEMETSIMMHLTPDLVLPLAEAGNGASRKPRLRAMREGWAWSQREWTKVTADTGIGNPARATAEKGRQSLEAITRKIADFLVELAACDPKYLYE